MDTNTTQNFTATTCPTCHHEVSVAHVPNSYTCLRAAGRSPEEAQEATR